MSGEIKKVGKKIVPTGWAPASRTVSTGKKLVTTAWSPTTVINKVKSFLQDPSTLGFRRIIDDWRKILCCGVGNNLTLLENTEFDNVSGSARPDGVILNPLVGFDLGPVAIGNLSEGLAAWVWRARATNNIVYISRETDEKDAWGVESVWVTIAGNPITSLSLTWDQLGNPFIVYGQDGLIKVYWYDPTILDFTFWEVGIGEWPQAYLDERRELFGGDSDILVMFIREGILYQAIQRERFLQQHVLATDLAPQSFIELMAFDRYRLWLVISEYLEGHELVTNCPYSLRAFKSNLYKYYDTDSCVMAAPTVTRAYWAPVYQDAGDELDIAAPSVLSVELLELLITVESSTSLDIAAPEVLSAGFIEKQVYSGGLALDIAAPTVTASQFIQKIQHTKDLAIDIAAPIVTEAYFE